MFPHNIFTRKKPVMVLWIYRFFPHCNYNKSIVNCGCTELKKIAGLYNSRDFKIWFSTSTVDARCNVLGKVDNTDNCGIDNLDADGYGPWLEMGTYNIVVNSYTELISGSIHKQIKVMDTGGNLATTDVLTESNSDGRYAGKCDGSSASAGNPIRGNNNVNDSRWSYDVSLSGSVCTGNYPVYCFEQPDL